MDAGGGHADEHVPGRQILPVDQILPVHDPHRKPGQVVLLYRIKARHLRRLPADQGRSRLPAPLCHAAHDGGDLLRLVLAAGTVIQEKERLAARAGNVVHAHGHAVDADGVVLIQGKGQFQLRADPVGAGHQRRVLHRLKSFDRNRT